LNTPNWARRYFTITTFKDLPLEMVHRLIPKFFNLEGMATGLLKVSGNLRETKFDYKASIKESVFDKIFLGNVNSEGTYNGEFLYVNYANSINKEDKIDSKGIVPFDLNLNSKNFGKFFEDKLIKYNAFAKLNSMFFLSPYITELDSIRGDIKIDLSLSGVSSSIIRDGNIKFSNSNIYTMLINNPIIGVDGLGYLKQNNLTIEYLNGTSIKSMNDVSNKIEDNIRLSGSLDFTKFFEPFYDVTATSINNKNIYLDAIPIDLVGLIDSMNVKIFGKDTLNINGLIEVAEATLFHEFISEDIGETLIFDEGLLCPNI
jgi:hypothetical protein